MGLGCDGAARTAPARAALLCSSTEQQLAAAAVCEESDDHCLLDDEALGARMDRLGIAARRFLSLPPRGVFCTRTLDMRAIKLIGFDVRRRTL